MFRPRLPLHGFRDTRRRRDEGGLVRYDWAAEFDAHKFHTLYQDSALATKVTANAQAVGGWVNSGGSGGVLGQTTVSAKPTYYSAGINSAYPGVQFVTDDWMSIDFGSAQWTDGKYWCVFVGALPTFTGSSTNPWHFDATDITNASPSRWGNQDCQPSTTADRLDFYAQTTAKTQFNNRPLGLACWSVVVNPSGANNIVIRYLTTSAGSATQLASTQTVARDMRSIFMGARHTGTNTVDRIVTQMDVNYWAVMDYTNFPGTTAELAFMRELLARIGL